MKFIATLCSTNGSEPWGANVPMVFTNGRITTQLKTSYTHYKNIAGNGNVVIVYKNLTSEIIIKALAVIKNEAEGMASIEIDPTWMRVVENGKTEDVVEGVSIYSILNDKLGTENA